jgi:hypothetical protein
MVSMQLEDVFLAPEFRIFIHVLVTLLGCTRMIQFDLENNFVLSRFEYSLLHNVMLLYSSRPRIAAEAMQLHLSSSCKKYENAFAIDITTAILFVLLFFILRLNERLKLALSLLIP